MTSRLTIRARLTVVYGGLFLLAGALLLGLTYLLLERVLPVGVYVGRGTDVTKHSPGVRLTDPVVVGGVSVPVGELPRHLRSATLGSLLTQGGIALGVVTAGAI